MKAVQRTEYQCEICKHVYRNKSEALKCESRPVSQDRGVKVGDITVISMQWGHYASDRYWHTIAVSGKVIDSWGSRFLTFDDYVLNGSRTP